MFGHGLWCCPSSVGCLWCSWLGFGFGLLLGRVWFRGRPACPPPFPVPACGVGVCAGPGSRLCPALLGWVVGVCFLSFCFFFFFCPGLCGPCPSIPFLSGWAGGSLFIFFPFRCPFSPWAAFTGLVLPVSGGWSPCASVGVLSSVPSGGGVWPPVVLLAGGLAAVGCFCAFSPSLLLFFGGGGLACSSLCLPWAGARTGLHSVLSSGLLSSVAFCVAAFRPHGSGGLCRRWARRPFLPGLVLALPAGRLRQAAACGFGLGGWGCSCPFPSAVPAVIFWAVRHRCRQARCGPVCGLRCRVWRAGAAPSRVCGGWLRLVPQVRVSCVVLCRSVPRRVASCCGALHCGALWCGVLWSRVVPRWVSGGQPGLCRGAECGPECGRLVAGGCG